MTEQDAPTPTPKGQIEDAIAGAASDDTFVCTRVWEAWSDGTFPMSAEDFTLLAESPDMLSDMADDLILTLSAPSAIDRVTSVMPHHPDCFIRPSHGRCGCLEWRNEHARAAINALLGLNP